MTQKTTITVDGKEYVDKKSYELLEKRLDMQHGYQKELANLRAKLEGKPTMTLMKGQEACLDNTNSIGLGSSELSGTWVKTSISIEFMQRVVAALKNLKIDTVHMVFANDYPVVFGSFNEKTNVVSGIIVAPRVER
jgi:hypothetical protein